MDRYFHSAAHQPGEPGLEGRDYGGYPIHHFHSPGEPNPSYPLWVRTCGLDEWRERCFRRRTFSDTFSVEYVQSGVFIFQQNSVTMKVHPGEVFFVHLGADSSMRCETEFATKRTIIMRGPLLSPALESLGLNRVDKITLTDRGPVDRCFDRICDLSEAASPTRAEYLEAGIACYRLLVELAEQTTSRQHPPELRRAIEYIHSHLTRPLSLEELIRHSGVSGATLHRLFRRYLKTSPVNYCLDRRLERGKTLLENNLYSVKEVSELLSYSSPQYFASEFRKKFGKPPKQFKYRTLP